MGKSEKYDDKSYTYISILITIIYMYQDVVIIIITHFQNIKTCSIFKSLNTRVYEPI